MRAVGYRNPLPITDPEALIDIDLPDPTPSRRDLLVRVEAVSVNPVDVKVRAKVAPSQGDVRLLGFDAAGVVEAVGSDTSIFKPGDEVYYSGSIARQGTDAEFHVVDERIVGRKPASLTFPQAAAMPLTTITAWELLFHRLGIPLGDKSARRNAACHQRRRRRWLYSHSACTPIDGADGHRHCIAPREPGLGIGYGRPPCHRPSTALERGAGRCRICECRSGRKPDRDRASLARHCRGHRS